MATCAFPLCKRHAEDNGLCISHKMYAGQVKKTSAPKDEKPKPKRINRESEKMKKNMKEYRKIVKEMLAVNNRCELYTPACTFIAEGLHHMKGRGVLLLVKKYLKRACNACNLYVEEHPKYALEQGLSISKHQIEQDGQEG